MTTGLRNEMTEDQATALRKRLLARRARLLEFAVQQVEADLPSWDWLRMVADAQLAIQALDEENGRTS